jgi:MoaA/NifB/PqqE/SkfB family radical SAM enzyme
MSDKLYSTLKPVYWMDRLTTLRSGVLPPPVHVQLVLSDLCNQSCHHCAYRIPIGLSTELFAEGGNVNPNRRIPTDKALEIIDDCAAIGVQAIQFTGGGEPTVHKDHLRLFAHAQALGIKTALVTNGVKLDAEHPAIKAMSWVRVSIDAGNAETYASTRNVPVNHWHAAWRNIEVLSKSCEGVVSVGFVVTLENFREVEAAAQLTKESGAANMRVGAVFSSEGVGHYGDMLPEIRTYVGEARTRFPDVVIDVFDRRIEDLEAGSPTEALCGYQALTTYIGGDLGVYRCCNTAYTRAGKVADLHDVRFAHLFGRKVEAFDATGCRFCQFRQQNNVIAATQRMPTHAEFV